MSAVNLDGQLRPRRRPPLWPIAAAATLAATLLIALAFGLLADDRTDAIDEAVSERRPVPAPEAGIDQHQHGREVGDHATACWRRLARPG